MRQGIRSDRQPHVGVHVHDEEVEPAVVVEVEGLGADGAPGGAAEHLLGDVGEGAVAVVAVELAAAEHVGDEQVELAVVVVVEDGHVAAPAQPLQAGLLGHVGEGAVAVVVVEDVVFLRAAGPVLRDVGVPGK